MNMEPKSIIHIENGCCEVKGEWKDVCLSLLACLIQIISDENIPKILQTSMLITAQKAITEAACGASKADDSEDEE